MSDRHLPANQVTLVTQGLSKRFGGLIAVNHVDFQILKDQTTGIIGPNGSGKTTFFNLISGFLPPTEGRITFLDKDVTNVSHNKRVLQGMVRTFQLVSVFNTLTVWENLVLSSIRFKRENTKPLSFTLSTANDEKIRKTV